MARHRNQENIRKSFRHPINKPRCISVDHDPSPDREFHGVLGAFRAAGKNPPLAHHRPPPRGWKQPARPEVWIGGLQKVRSSAVRYAIRGIRHGVSETTPSFRILTRL